MGAFLKKFDSNGERWLLLGFYTYIVLVIAIEVVRRFGLSYSSVWGEETARYAFIYLVWIGAASAVRERAHIRIDVLSDLLPPRGTALLYMFADVLTLLLACATLYWTYRPGAHIDQIPFRYRRPSCHASLVSGGGAVRFPAGDSAHTAIHDARYLRSSRRTPTLSRRKAVRLMLYPTPGAALDIGWTVAVPLLLMIVLFALSVPVWVALGIASVALLWATDVLPMSLFSQALFDGVDAFALIAIPLYILTGDALVRSGLSNKLIDIAEATLGSLRSGLGTSTVLGCGFFSCISGSDAAGAAAVGRIMYKRLVQRGYPPAYACALVASGSCTGILIPPSISYIIIGLVLGISASTLFIAAAVPGVMIMVSIMITNIVLNRIHGYENSDDHFSFRRWLRTIWDGRYALAIPIIIWGGIYSGVFTPTEAAAAAVVITITIGLWQGTLTLADFPKMLESSAKVNGVIVPIIAFALPLAQAFSALNLPQAVLQDITQMTSDPTVIILLMLAVLILAGCVMETTPNIVILAPIMLPIAQDIGMDPIHFCIFMVTALGVGFITPPLGLNLFVLSGLTGEKILPIAAKSVPYVVSMLIVVLMLGFIPALSLWALR